MSLIKNIQLKLENNINIVILFIVTFTIYIKNVSPSVYGGDSGDFIAAVITKGVPHPSGYPLYTILGILAQYLPLSRSAAWKYGLVSSLFSSLSVIIFYLTVVKITKKRTISMISAFTLAFIYPFWLYAETVEVISLHNFFILIISFLTIYYLNSKNNKYLYLLSFFMGLSLTNNLTIILIFLPVALSILFTNTKILLQFKLILINILLFFLGLLPYLYLPLAALHQPAINWGNAINMTNFLNLILRKEYGWGSASLLNKDIFLKNMTFFLQYLKIYTSILIPLISFLGIIYLIRKRLYSSFLFLIVSIILFGPFFILWGRTPTYSFGDMGVQEKFNLSFIIFLLFFFSFGLSYFAEISTKFLINKKLKNITNKVTILAFSVIPIIFYIINEPKTNLSKVFIGDNFARDVLSTLPTNTILDLHDDYIAFNCLYFQQAFSFRKDVQIPGKYNNNNTFLTNSGIIWNANNDQNNDKNTNSPNDILILITGLLLDKKVSIYSDQDFKSIYNNRNITSIPVGLLYEIDFENNLSQISKQKYLSKINHNLESYHTQEILNQKYLIGENIVLTHIARKYAASYLLIAQYLKDHYNDIELYQFYLNKAKEIDPFKNFYD